MSQKRPAAKHKIDRSLGCNLWGRAKSPYNRRQYGPGQHGQNRSKPTDYAIQLRAKQQLKGYYANIGEKRFRRYYQEAARRKGDTSVNLIQLLESRLDAIVYRSMFVPTVFAARQFVSHGHVKVNGKRVNIPSYNVKAGDVIEVKESSLTMPIYIQATTSKEREVPEYLNVDHKKGSCTYARLPEMDEVPYPVKMKPNLIVEFYYR